MGVIAGAGALALCAWLVWQDQRLRDDPWIYSTEYWESPLEHPDGKTHYVPVPVRTHRITGEKQNQGGPRGKWGHFVW